MSNRAEQIARIEVVDLVGQNLIGEIGLRTMVLRVVALHLLSFRERWKKIWLSLSGEAESRHLAFVNKQPIRMIQKNKTFL